MLAGLSLDKLVFDPLFPEEGSNVGAWLRDPNGDLITSNPVSLFATFNGTPPGGTTDILITADNGGPVGNVTLGPAGAGDTVQDLIDAWNLLNPTNTVTLTTGNGAQVVTTGQSITLGGGEDKVPLDVNIVGGINVAVDLDGIYDAINNPKPDNVGIVVFDRAVTPGLSDEKFLPTGAGPGPVASADIPKVHALDVNSFGLAFNADTGDWQSIQVDPTTGGVIVNVAGLTTVADDDPDSGDPLKVGSRSRWGVLTALSTTMDRADLISDKYRRVYVNDGSNVAMNAVALVVGTSAVQIAASALDGRRTLLIQNLGPHAIFVGQSNAVTVASGIRIPANGSMDMDVGQDIAVWAISSAANNDVRIMQLA